LSSNRQLKSEWATWAKQLNGERITVEGVPRIWFEHTAGSTGPSNPDHVFEIHAVTKMTTDSRSLDLTTWIHDVARLPGISDATIEKILGSSGVTVTSLASGDVEVTFDRPGRIGNFGRMTVRLELNTMKNVAGGHRTVGQCAVSESSIRRRFSPSPGQTLISGYWNSGTGAQTEPRSPWVSWAL
jgi:hypothetical protein